MSLPALPLLPAFWTSRVFGENTASPGAEGSEDAEALPNTERLAFIGDTIVHLGVTNWLHERYPKHRHQSLRAKLLDLLSEKPREWARLYKLPSHVVVTRAEGQGVAKIHPISKGDLFRAYIGAVYLDRGGDHGGGVITSDWIKQIMEFEEQKGPKKGEDDSDSVDSTEDDIVSTREEDGDRISGMLNSLLTPSSETTDQKPKTTAQLPINIPVSNTRNSLSTLNEKATQKKSPLDWNDNATGPDHAKTWLTKLTVEGKEFAGSGHNKKQARSAAAETALKSLKWI